MGQDDLRQVLSSLPQFATDDLIVGNTTSDDAAVLRIEGNRAIVQTVDFFTPIVDDPRLFGAIAAANSVSDIYAMGAEPILGLAIAAFPTGVLPLSVLHEILAGGVEKAKEAGFPIGGGHTIIDDVPKYGLAVTGIVDVDRIVRNDAAKPGDLLYLTKPIGNGILVTAWRGTSGFSSRVIRRSGRPPLDESVDWMLRLNRAAAKLMTDVGVRAATDVTGYGLIGHLLEICRGSGVGATLELSRIPVLPGAREWLKKGFVSTGSIRNREATREHVRSSIAEDEFTLLNDAQTSGGLLLSVPPQSESKLVDEAKTRGVFLAKIGRVEQGDRLVALVP